MKQSFRKSGDAMYIMTLEINQKCNLKCKYCYLGEKDGSKMSIATAYKGVEIAFEKAKFHKDRKIWFDFVGGEAFIDFPMIKDIVAYIEKRNQKGGNILQYSITTNATLFTQEIIDYLVDKKFSLKVSIDGNKAVNDMNRIAKAHYSVHDKILSQLDLIRNFEKRTNKIVQVTNVVTNNNYKSYADSVKYLVGKIGFRMIDTGIDYYSDWSETEMAGLENEIRKIFNYFIERAYQGKGFRWSFAESLVDIKKEPCKRFYSCGAGIVSSYVRHDGSLYACPGNLNKEVELGDVNLGFDRKRIDWLQRFNDIDSEKCHACSAFSICTEKSCIMMNIGKTGSPNQPAPMLCWTRLLLVKIYRENEKLISCIAM